MTRKDAIAAGLPRYFTGKPCKHGHLAERYTANKTCCECANTIANQTKAKDRAKYVKTSAAWLRLRPEKAAEYQLKRNRANPGPRNAWTANYRSAKAARMPDWLTEDDQWMIQEAYDLAARRTKILGFSWHVDHIVPLRGATVSGLHVPWNLQVIPGSANTSKGNKFHE